MFATSHLVNSNNIPLMSFKNSQNTYNYNIFYKFIFLFTRIVIKCTARVT